MTRRDPDAETPATRGASEETSELDGSASSTIAAYLRDVPDVKAQELETAHRVMGVLARVVGDESIPLERRAPWYAYLRKVKLNVERAVKPVTPELTRAMAEQAGDGERVRFGPLRLVWRAQDVKYPVNDPDNWGDDGVQSLLSGARHELNALNPGDEPIIVEVPAHLEVVPMRLAAAMHLGSRAARRFYEELKRQRLRTEEAKTASIEVD